MNADQTQIWKYGKQGGKKFITETVFYFAYKAVLRGIHYTVMFFMLEMVEPEILTLLFTSKYNISPSTWISGIYDGKVLFGKSLGNSYDQFLKKYCR